MKLPGVASIHPHKLTVAYLLIRSVIDTFFNRKMYQVPVLESDTKTWFYIRKSIFQGLLPIILKLTTLFDLWRQSEGSGPFYQQIYFYTTIFLGLYYCLSVTMDLIFSICAEELIFQKAIDLTQTTAEVAFSFDRQNYQNNLIIIKRVFKLRYSKYRVFHLITQVCWVLGVNCPMLIPLETSEAWLEPDEVLYDSRLMQSQVQNSQLRHYIPLTSS